jgi:RHS repeat-associated protein
VNDESRNDTVYTLKGKYIGQVVVYQGLQQGNQPLTTSTVCYNGNGSNCSSASVLLPINQTDTYTQRGSMGTWVLKENTYDSYHNLVSEKRYDYGTWNQETGAFTGPLIYTHLVSYGTDTTGNGNCASVGNRINNRVCVDQFNDGSGNMLSWSSHRYDNHGNQTDLWRWTGVSHGHDLHTSVTYNPNGTVNVSTDTNGTATTLTYNACNGLFPTNVASSAVSWFTVQTWDCNGGVMTSSADANGQKTAFNFVQNGVADPFYRVLNIVDPIQNITVTEYGTGSTIITSALTLNSSSLAATAHHFDGYGRPSSDQRYQSPTPQKYDTVSYTYDANGRPASTSMPCSVGMGASCPTTPATTQTYDPLGRPLVATDGGGGTLTNTYTGRDVLSVVSSPSSSKQYEYDGLGRLISVCEISSSLPGVGTCNQDTSNKGYWTRYQYDALGRLTGVCQDTSQPYSVDCVASPSSGQQTRKFAYDGLGRMISESNPESGLTQYFYDSAPTSPGAVCPGPYSGDLVKMYDASGNTICWAYDGLHRPTSTTYFGPNSNGLSRYLAYDSATVNGVVMRNANGHLAEAYTAATQGGTKATDEGFSYSARGELADFYESTQHSGGYYHSAATFYPNGSLDTLWMPGIPTITYGGLDGEGRPTTVSASSGQNPVTSISYDNTGGSGRVLGATYGSGDSDTFGYDTNTGRMTNYTFAMNGQSEIGNLTWNTNGTPKNLVISDPFNSADNGQTCDYIYDDIVRLASVGCGSAWSQTFTYDPFANITKSGSISWRPGYNTTTNRYTLGGTSYDNDGNLTNDTFHSYTWDSNNRPVSIDSIGIAYDALGRQVEQNQSGTYYQIVYTPQATKLAVMNSQTIQKVLVPLPGGGTAEYLSSGLSHYRHLDWLGSDRLASSYQKSSTPVTSAAYAPFGEPYATSGNGELSFTGANKDTDSLQYDFPARQYDPKQGRWISPDPAGLKAADPKNPQTWNRYAYTENNPLSRIDPSGMCDLIAGGFTQTPGTLGTQTQEQLADIANANIVFPFSGQGLLGSIGSLLGSTYFAGSSAEDVLKDAVIDTIQQSIAADQTTNLTFYSGSAGLFANIYGELPEDLKTNIASVTYVSPGGGWGPLPGEPFTELQKVPFGVQFYNGGDSGLDLGVTLTGSPAGVSLGCAHVANCLFGKLFNYLAMKSKPCSNPGTFSRKLVLRRRPWTKGGPGLGLAILGWDIFEILDIQGRPTGNY